jgi:hypothetical protein
MERITYSLTGWMRLALLSTVFSLGLTGQAAWAQSTAAANITAKTTEPAVELAEQMPEYPGGFMKLLDELNASVHYPTGTVAPAEPGCWMVRFTVGTDGQVRGTTVEPSASNKISTSSPEGKATAQAVWAAVREVVPAPWKPGMQAGKPVAVLIELPLVVRR